MEKITKGHPLSQSEDIVKANIETLKQLFPTIVKEGKIDMQELKALLDEEIETSEEYYRFTWAGKNEARKEANKPSTATLRPCKEESKNWDTTGNIFIEGDNLEVLKLLQKSYAGKIKMMYFDPPYNTGKDFVYRDNYSDNLSNYLSITGQIDDEGKKLSTNSESDGRYHSNWLNMMYPRLKLARNLLTDDGVVFISIDDHEVQNLRKLCDEIFGEENFVGHLSIINNLKGRNDKKNIAQCHEYLLIYQKSNFSSYGLPLTEEQKKAYKYVDETGRKYALRDLRKRGRPDRREDRPNMYFPIWYNPNSKTCSLSFSSLEDIEIYPKRGDLSDGRWRWGFDTVKENLNILHPKYSKAKNRWDIEHRVYLDGPIFIEEDDESDNETVNNENDESEIEELIERTSKSKSFWIGGELSTDVARRQFKNLFKDVNFDYPKSIDFIRKCICMGTMHDEIVLDFFAGSGTTAHAVMLQNSEDGFNRKFICVQLPELIDEKNPAFKVGFKSIADICKERIRRAGATINNEIITVSQTKSFNTLDIGFKVFKLDSSNINAWDSSVDNLEQHLFNSQNNIKSDRTEDDILYEILLKYGLDLTVPITEKNINSCKVFCIGAGVLFVCLSDNITTQVAEEIGKWKEDLQPATCRALFKDNGFADDVAKTNSIQILRQYGIEEANSI